MKVSKVALKLELKDLNNNLSHAFDEYNKLTKLLNYFLSNLWFEISEELEKDDEGKIKASNVRANKITRKYLKLFKKVCELANVIIISDVLEETFARAMTLYINAYNSNGSKPNLVKFADSIPVRLKTNGQGNIKFKYNGGLFVEYSLGKRNNPIRGKALISINKELIKNTLKDAKIGDPSTLIKKQTKKGERYYLYLSASKSKPKPADIKNKDKIRVIGVDIGISTHIAVLSCIEYNKNDNTYKIINNKGIESKRFILMLDKYEEKKQRRSSAKHKEHGVQKGLTLKKENRKGESLRVDYTKQILGYTINQIIKFAKENNADVIILEDLTGLYKEKSKLKKMSKILGNLYNDINKYGLSSLYKYLKHYKTLYARRRNKTNGELIGILNELIEIEDKKKITKQILRIKNRLKRLSIILSYMPYYQLQTELENEASWNGIILKKIGARNTSITCIRCGNIDKQNRITRSLFRCSKCSFEMHADFIASINIALRGSLLIANKVKKGSKINDIIRQSIRSRQERVSGRMNKHDATNSLPPESKSSEARGVSRLTPAPASSRYMTGDDGVLAMQEQTDGPSKLSLVAGANKFTEQKGNGG